MTKTITDQQLQADGTLLVTKFSDGSLLCEPLTSEQAAQWTAENKF